MVTTAKHFLLGLASGRAREEGPAQGCTAARRLTVSHKLQVLGYSGVAQRDTDEPKHARIFGIDCIRQRLERQHVTRLHG